MKAPEPASARLFAELVAIVRRLRGPEGCPWDREQTHASLLPYFLEEAYEVIESIDQKNWQALPEELGDILLHIIFQTDIGRQAGEFSLEDVLRLIIAKMVSRHPHVFGDKSADGPFHARQNWEAVKHREKGRASRLDGVPVNLPALIRAQRLQEKASYAGFDWEHVEEVWNKVHKEIGEVRQAQTAGNREKLEEELGDLLFSVVNLARFFHISSEDALRKTCAKFVRRFQLIEKELQRQGRRVEDASLEEMDRLWETLKTSGSREADSRPGD